MANREQLAMLRQGADAWNAWRRANASVLPDLTNADLSEANLSNASLAEANLREADLFLAEMYFADLTAARLTGAGLVGTVLDETELAGVNLREARLDHTKFANVDLRGVLGLDEVVHQGPSTVGIDTLYASGGEIPEVFLRGCGVPERFITYARSLVGSAIEFYSCFISYSSKDEAFAKRFYNDLQGEGVRCWYAAEDLKTGDRLRQTIDEAIRVREKVVLILSEASITSSWVEREVLSALAEEDRRGKTILFPVRFHDAVMETDAAWASGIWRDTRIGDFTGWERQDAYRTAFERVLRDLKSEGRVPT